MVDLLALPREILQSVLTTLIIHHGLKPAIKARLVCKDFDGEMLSAIWVTKALEGPDRPKGFVDERILTEYLLAQTMADRTRRHHLTTVIYETLEYVDHLTTKRCSLEYESIREACLAVSRNSTCRLPDPLGILSHSRIVCAPSENALALATYLGLAPLVQQLIEEGVMATRTYFGDPLICATKRADSSIISLYLNTKLKVQQNGNHEATSGSAVDGKDLTRPQSKGEGRRGISEVEYEDAIRNAAVYGTTETLTVLTRAAKDDGAFGPGSNVGHSLFRGVKKSPNPVQDLILLLAARRGGFDVVQLALDNGATPNARANGMRGYYSPLEAAAKFGHAGVVELLLARGANPCPMLPSHGSPLQGAIRGGHMDVIKVCLDAGMTNFSRLRPRKNHPLVLAVSYKRLDVLRLLLDNGVTFENDSELDKDLSARAALRGDVEIQAVLAQKRRQQQT